MQYTKCSCKLDQGSRYFGQNWTGQSNVATSSRRVTEQETKENYVPFASQVRPRFKLYCFFVENA